MVLATPGTLGYIAATIVMTASFMSYIASSENIIDEVFGLKRWFAVLFAVVAAGLAAANVLNGRVVEALGLRRLVSVVPHVQLGVSAMLGVLALTTAGKPPFALFMPLLIVVLMTQQVTMVNINSAAMLPLGHVAGSAAAVIGATPMVFGSLLGSLVDARFDGTVTPLSLAFVLSSVLAVTAVRHALRASA
jgi:DHA1 family bicyclomycin/chloramphenicol resistance-like MFS transporter